MGRDVLAEKMAASRRSGGEAHPGTAVPVRNANLNMGRQELAEKMAATGGAGRALQVRNANLEMEAEKMAAAAEARAGRAVQVRNTSLGMESEELAQKIASGSVARAGHSVHTRNSTSRSSKGHSVGRDGMVVSSSHTSSSNRKSHSRGGLNGSGHTLQATSGHTLKSSSGHTSSGHTLKSSSAHTFAKGTSGHGSVAPNRGLRRTPSEQEVKKAMRASKASTPGARRERVVRPDMDEKMTSIHLTRHPDDPSDLEDGNLPYPEHGRRGDLAVANPVSESRRNFHLEEAEEVDPNKLQELTPEQQKTQIFKRNCLVALFVIAMGIIIGVIFAIAKSDGEKDKAATITAPTMAPSPVVTAAPSTLMHVSLPLLTLEVMMNNPLSPQAKAYDWLSSHPFVQELADWRKEQLFALATFYYAMDGPSWPDIVQRSWMEPNVHECHWFSREFIDAEMEFYLGEAVGTNSIDVDICTEDGRYITLALSLLHLSQDHDSVVMPPEIGWLSSLESLKIDLSNVKANLSELLLFEDKPALSPNVSTLSLFANNIYGSIPTQIANMKPLTYLDISTNKLSGTIPTILGTLTHLGELYLQSNAIGGSLPTELGHLEDVHRMDLSSNALTSTLPAEINAMTSLEWLWIRHNNLEGTLTGSDLGALTNLIGLYLQNNSLTGRLDTLITPQWAETHSHLMRYLHLASNNFDSTIPTEVGLMTNLKQLNLSHAGLTGTIPSQLGLLNASNNQIALLGNKFEGALPVELCPWICLDVTSPFTIQEFLETSLLVASNRCDCTLGDTYPLENVNNEIVVNVRFDEYPDETEWVLQKLLVTPRAGMVIAMDNPATTSWETVDRILGVPEQLCELVSYKHNVTSNTLYHFYVTDSFGDGNCCNHGRGAVSLTNSTIAYSKSDEEYNPYKGTIVWNSWDAGFTDFAEVYVWVDSEGRTSVVNNQDGFALAKRAALL